ncbi:MAG: YitT family protein [Lachnospiraceae bacterium]|nr:YitT family protein [Lachnospiraceae bacterium]
MEKVKGRSRELALDVLYDILGGFLQAIGLHCFIDSIDIAPGGATGLAILLNRFTHLPLGTLTLMINIPLLITSWIWLGKERTLKTFKTVVILTVILDFIVTPYVPIYHGDKLVSCIFGAVMVGASLAVVFMRGSTTGGGDIMAKLLQKFRPHMQTSTAVMLTDLVIIAASMVVFHNIEAGLYGLINMVLGSYVIDMILYGTNKSTMITVMSAHNQEIAERLMEELERGVTFYKSRGAYSGKEGEALICVIDRKQFYKAKKMIYGIDREAFMIVSEAKEVYGEGFLDSDWEV